MVNGNGINTAQKYYSRHIMYKNIINGCSPESECTSDSEKSCNLLQRTIKKIMRTEIEILSETSALTQIEGKNVKIKVKKAKGMKRYKISFGKW